MAWLVATFGVIIGSVLVNLSAAKEDACDLHAAVGQSLTLPFVYEELKSDHFLRWTHNSSIIFYEQEGRLSIGKPTDINANGSLLLKNLQFSSAGFYQATLLHPNGTLAEKWTARLCLFDKVSKPKLTYNCDFKSSAVNLNCSVADPHGLLFSWELDEKPLTAERRHYLSISLAQLKGERNFSCSVENKISKEKSDTVSPVCKTPSAAALLCFASKTVLAVLVGGTGLILLLFIVIISLCCRRRNKSETGSRDNEELRMLSVTRPEPERIIPEYETMHATEEPPPPAPEPSPRSCYENVSHPEAQTGNKQQLVATSAEERQPSPVPKPRTKSPAPTVWGGPRSGTETLRLDGCHRKI